MRTTWDLEKPILDGLKSLQTREGLSLGKIASRLLADALAGEAAAMPEQLAFHWLVAPMVSKVNMADKDVLYRALEQA